MQRCYCGHSDGSILKSRSQYNRMPQQELQRQLAQKQGQKFQQQQRERCDLQSLTSSSRQSTQPTQFIKHTSVKHARQQGLGLGHSNSALCRDFSRRNSAATVLSHCSSCCSSGNAPQQQQQSRIKVLSWAGPREERSSRSNGTHCEHTNHRRNYEQRACVASHVATQGQCQAQSRSTATPSPVSTDPQDDNNELQRLLNLQKFRLLNASDCFSAQRQDELRLQQAYDKFSMPQHSKCHKNTANEEYRQATKTSTPYALRQKLLQLRLQEERANGRGTGAACAPLERSCALKYNCHP